MPYLQLDVPGQLDIVVRRRLAMAVGRSYAETMAIERHIPVVAIRCHDGGPWRLEEGELREVVVLSCDVQRGRDAKTRGHAAQMLAHLLAKELNVDLLRIVVEFTQHDADETFRYGRIAEPETSAPNDLIERR